MDPVVEITESLQDSASNRCHRAKGTGWIQMHLKPTATGSIDCVVYQDHWGDIRGEGESAKH